MIEVGGADRSAFLHNLLSNDIASLAPRGSCRAALLTPTAKLIAELVVLSEADRHWLLMPRVCLTSTLSGLNRYLITENVTLADRTEAWTLLGLQGPKTPEIVHELSTARLADYSVTGDPGVIVMVSPHEVIATRNHLTALGAAAVAWDAVHVCRIEAGVPWWGIDMDETTLLPETGLEQRLASFTKGCYVGQEIVARVDTYGSLSSKLMPLVCEGATVPERGDEIRKDGQPVGQITSACFSPSRNRSVALGYVKRPFYQEDTAVQIGIRHVTAVVTARSGRTPAGG